MELEPLSPAIGAEVKGTDLSRVLSPQEADDIRQAFARYHLLLFREQEITFDEQTRFAALFGPAINTHKMTPDGQQFVSNTVQDAAVGDGELGFHQDHSFFDLPDTNVILLYALEVPARGGETVFANTQRAYEDLPDSLKRRISGLHALHIAGRGVRISGEAPDIRHVGPRTSAIQPTVWMQPDSGKAVLYVSQLVDHFIELGKNESDTLLSQLEAHLYRQELLYKHKWRVGDVVIWSNRILQHSRTAFDPSEKRTLRRSTIGTPEALKEDLSPTAAAGR